MYYTRDALAANGWLVVLHIDWMSFFFSNNEGKEMLSEYAEEKWIKKEKQSRKKRKTCVPNCHSVWIQKYI